MLRYIFRFDIYIYSLYFVKWAFVVDLPEKYPFQLPFLTSAASSANQRRIVQHHSESLNVPVLFSVNVRTLLTTSIRQRLRRKANIRKEEMLKYLQ